MRRRERLALALCSARAAGVATTRAERLAGRPPARIPLSELAGWPAWPVLEPGARERVWKVAALVAARDALPDVIDGATLRAYAAAVGEDAFEAVLALPPGGDATLPSAGSLTETGRHIAESALPRPLAAAMQVETRHNPAAIDTISLCERIAA